jgi:mono/diheme cytochrome c family protein
VQEKPKARQEASPVGDQAVSGEKIYLQFCGGCHGFNGIAWYVNSPSFALRERLEKSDVELTNSIKNGLGAMPAWEYMLGPDARANLR